MGNFNYSQLHIFNKKGNELPLVYDTNFKIEIPNRIHDNAVFYGVLNPDNTISNFYCKYQGGRYNKYEFTNYSENDSEFTADTSILLYLPSLDSSISTNNVVEGIASIRGTIIQHGSFENTGNENLEEELLPHYITEIEDINIDFSSYDIKYPSLTFNSGVTFDKVSTDLVETQSLYILFEENNDFKKISDIEGTDIKTWSERYKLLFFIDCQKQSDFRFFTTNSDEVVWTNKILVDFSKNDFRVDIGFTTPVEGIYEQPIIVCLIDSKAEGDDKKQGLITPIGSILMTAEAVGEDERYRTLFTNFGLPHPSEYMKVFKNTDLDEANIDNIQLNQNSKMLFLSYSDIFPYVGTYKALINAVKLLNYDDVFFKEWYKIIGKDSKQGGYVNYDMQYHADLNANTINNLTIEERIHLRKMNWISMIYKINEEIATKGEDRWGFPYTKSVHSYDDKESLIKLIALKEWLQKYIVGVNCRIIDIGGEGIYYERYRLDSYGSYQNIIEWNNVKNLAPYFENVKDEDILIDASAKISVNIGLEDEITTLGDIQKDRIIEYCEGYINEDGIYHHRNDTLDDNENYIYVGGTFDCPNHLNRYELRASSKIENFIFDNDYIVDASTDILYDGINSSRLRVTDNEIEFNTIDLFNNKTKSTIFRICPIIQLEKANIRIFSKLWSKSIQYKIYPDLTDDTKTSYFIKNEITGDVYSTVDYITLLPPTIINESEDTVILKPFGKDEITLGKTFEKSVISDYLQPQVVYSTTGMTYGLKYSANNIYNLPFFSIFGYQVDKIDSSMNIPEDTEYILEILDGKMIFPDYENNRTIYLNFNFDNDTKEQTVEVNTVYNSEQFYPISYLIKNQSRNNYINNFVNNNNYSEFVEKYLENPNSVIKYNFIQNLIVNNIGEFTVDVLGFDLHNNIFAANCDGKALIKMPETNLLVYTNNKNEGKVEGTLVDSLEESFIDFCLYKPNYLISGISPIIDDINKTIKVKYPSYSYSLHKPEKGEYVHFVNITDRYGIKAIDSIESHTYLNNEGVNTYEGYTLISEANCPIRYNRVLESNDYDAITGLNNDVEPDYDENKYTVSKYLNKFYDAPYTFSDVNVIFYNELGGYPIAQTYANMANESAFYRTDKMKDNYINNDYRICIDDDSWKGYVWASVKDTESQLIVNRLSDKILSNIIDSSWGIKLYEIENDEIPNEASEDDEIAETLYLNIDYQSFDKTVNTLVKKLFDNFKLGSVNEHDTFTENSDLQISRAAAVEESDTPAYVHRSFIDNLNDIKNNSNRITKDTIASFIEPIGNNEINTIGGLHYYAAYPLLSEIVSTDNSLEYPYTKNQEQQNTNILVDIETLLFTENYDITLEDNIIKLVNDYELKDDTTNLSIFEKIALSFIDTNTIENIPGNIQYKTLEIPEQKLFDKLTIEGDSDDGKIIDIINFWKYPNEYNSYIDWDHNENPSIAIYPYDNWEMAEILELYKPTHGDSLNNENISINQVLFNSKSLINYQGDIRLDASMYESLLNECHINDLSNKEELFLLNLTKYEEQCRSIHTLKDFLSIYLTTDFDYNTSYDNVIIESLFSVLKDKTEINNRIYTDATYTLFTKLYENNSIFADVANDNLYNYDKKKNVLELVTDQYNYLEVYPDLEKPVSIDGSVYITSKGYKIITNNITQGQNKLELGDYIHIGDNYTTIGFIEHLDNGKYSIKTDDPVCTFTQEEYNYPVNYIDIPLSVYKNEYYEYTVWDNEPLDSSLPDINEYGKQLYAYYNGALYKYTYVENLDADNIIEWKDTRYIVNFSHIDLKNGLDLSDSVEKKSYYLHSGETVIYNEYSLDITNKINTLHNIQNNITTYTDLSDEFFYLKIPKSSSAPGSINGNDFIGVSKVYRKELYNDNYLNDYIYEQLEYILDNNMPDDTKVIIGDNDLISSTSGSGMFAFARLNDGNYTKDLPVSSTVVVNYFVISKNPAEIFDVSTNTYHITDGENTYDAYVKYKHNSEYSITWFSKQYSDNVEIDLNNDIIYVNYYHIIPEGGIEQNMTFVHDTSGNITFDKFTNYDLSIQWDDIKELKDVKYSLYNYVVTVTRTEEIHHYAYAGDEINFNVPATLEYLQTTLYRDVNGDAVLDSRGIPHPDTPDEEYRYLSLYNYIVDGYRGGGQQDEPPLSYAKWDIIDSNVNIDNDETREMIIMQDDEPQRSYVIHTKNSPLSTPFITYTSPETPRCYVTSNGYSINIPEDIFNDSIKGNDYILTNLENNYTDELVKIYKIIYLEKTKEYKLLLNQKIYQFNEEEYNETYVSKKVNLTGYKFASNEASIDVIKTNLQCIFVNCLANMNDITSTVEDSVQQNIRKYYAALYVYYSWILIKLIDNIKYIVDNTYTTSYTNLVDTSNVYINKYLTLTNPYSLANSYEILDSYIDEVKKYFYSSDSSTGEKLLSKLIDPLYTEDRIPIYDKLLTLSATDSMESIKYMNWATKGEVHVIKSKDVPEGVYAVVTRKSGNELDKNDTYKEQINEVSYESIVNKDSIDVSDEKTKKQNNTILEDSSIYYVKVGNNVKSGYSRVTSDIPENAVTSIKDILGSSYISTYVKPTWIAPIKLGILDKSIVEGSPLDPNYDYMYVIFNSNIFKTTFKVGEKVKIIFESVENKDYIGQSTYEVVGYDLTSNSLIIKGYINEEYLNAHQEDVWSRLYTKKNEDGTYTVLQNCVPLYREKKTYSEELGENIITYRYEYNNHIYEGTSKETVENEMVEAEGFIKKLNNHGASMYFIESDKIITVNDSYYTLTDLELISYDENTGQPILNEFGEPVTNTINISIPIKYMAANGEENVDGPAGDSEIVNEDITEDEINDGSNINEDEDILWYYRVYSILPSGKTILPVTIHAETSERINMYISYAHHSYVDYPMQVIDSIENEDGTTEIEIEYNSLNRRLFDFIDDTFSITSREFNIGEGMGAWMNSTRKTIKLNDSIPDICNKPVYCYRNISPELSNNLVAFGVDLTDTGIDGSTCTNYWKVYKRSSVLDKDVLAFESFNPVLYLDYTDKGVYSIESFVCDKYGNTASKYYKGIYKVK